LAAEQTSVASVTKSVAELPMLIPLTRQTFKELIPPVATGAQYKYFWGKPPDFLRRMLISAVIVILLLVVYSFVGSDIGPLVLITGLIAGLYWLWGPILWASLRNAECRKYQYCGFWQGRVLDIYITDEDLSTITKVSDIYIPSRDVWVSDYPYLRRDLFVEVSQQIKKGRQKKGRDGANQRREVKRRSPADY
jgi:hypothetical protein